MKKFFLLLPAIVFFFALSNPVFATVSETFVTTQNTASNVTNPNNCLGSVDGTYCSATSASSSTFQMNVPAIIVPSGSVINSIKFRFYANTTGNSGSHYLSPFNHGFTSGCNSGAQPSFSMANNTHDYTFSSSNCNNWATLATVSNLSAGLGLKFLTAASNWNVDAFSLVLDYTAPPSLVITEVSSVASPSSGLIHASFSGTFATYSASMTCSLHLYESCDDGYVGSNSISTIDFIGATPRSSTIAYDGGYYEGVSNLAVSGAWSAAITVPYHAGTSCHYPYSYTCFHLTGGVSIVDSAGQGYSSSGADYDARLYASVSASLNTGGYVAPSCSSTDWICSVIADMKKYLYDLFIPSTRLQMEIIDKQKQLILSKVPFAYVMPIFFLNQDTPATLSAMPNFSLTINSFETPIVATAGAAMPVITSVLSIVKTVLTFGLYLLFIFYILSLVKRLVSK